MTSPADVGIDVAYRLAMILDPPLLRDHTAPERIHLPMDPDTYPYQALSSGEQAWLTTCHHLYRLACAVEFDDGLKGELGRGLTELGGFLCASGHPRLDLEPAWFSTMTAAGDDRVCREDWADYTDGGF